MAHAINVQPIEISLNSIWMLHPEYRSLRQHLENRGYSLKEQARGSSIVLATKGSIEILVNLERRVLGIASETSTKDLLIACEDLEQIYEDLGVEPSNLLFYEFIGSYSADSSSSPLEKLGNLKIEGDLLAKIGSVLETELVPLGLNVTVKNGNPTSAEWMHLVVEPLYASANKKYNVRVICRGKKDEVVNFAKNIEKRITKIIEKLEVS